MQAMEISKTGLDVEWRRLEVIAENLANTGTARTAAGAPYTAMALISGPRQAFSSHMDGAGAPKELRGVEVYGEAPMNVPSRRVHEPGNPQADADGYVEYPGFDQAAEMTLMLKTSRAYESNIVAMNAARDMYLKALELGRKG